MNCPQDDMLLDDLVDGELDQASRLPLERHLAGCERCREEVDRRRRLQAAIDRLPREIAPGEELLDGIRRQALAAERAAPTLRSFAAQSWVAAAAAVLLVGVIAFLAGRQGRETVLPTADSAMLAGQSLPDYRLAEVQYQKATATLLAELDRVRDQLPPESLAAVEENLRIIDQAIAEVHAALDLEPGSGKDGHLLAALHKKKLDTLWRATRLSS